MPSTAMRCRQMLDVLDKTGLSPEKAAAELGVSGMTLRRWRGKPAGEELPEIYRRASRPLLTRLVGEGKLSFQDPDVAAALAPDDDGFLKTLREVGITHEALAAPDKFGDAVAKGLAKIGGDENRQKQVASSGKLIASLRAMGRKWKDVLDDMKLALASDQVTALDKLVAVGALFYLIMPFDLIPDAIPVFGYMDDFIVLTIAALYLRKRYPRLFPKRAAVKKSGK
jgi:uncharacterized membrane protein YkvA (DUF1232 family)